MRRILIDHARRRATVRHGGGRVRIHLAGDVGRTSATHPELLDLDRALRQLERLDPRRARLVELRFFAGLTLDETAAVLAISQATVVREWRLARAFLNRELYGDGDAVKGK